jgi:hypothetical protein
MTQHSEKTGLDRRSFLSTAAAAGAAISISALPAGAAPALSGDKLAAGKLLGGLRRENGTTPIPGAEWHVATKRGDGISYTFPAGTLSSIRYVAGDFLLDGNQLAVFQVILQEGEKGRRFRFSFGALNQASFRMRMPLSLVDQNRWMIDREGAFLKPLAGGDRVDVEKVDRMTLTVSRMGTQPVRWCMTPLVMSKDEVAKLTEPVLPKGKLLDELGQSTLHQWEGRTRNVGELKERIQTQWKTADSRSWPDSFSRWGGWKQRKLGEGSGFFRTHHDGERWWLADPDGYAFWSSGLDCVRVDTDARCDGLETALTFFPEGDPEFAEIFGLRGASTLRGRSINYLAANMIRALGKDGWRDKWARIALAEMKRLRFNTVANWSEYDYAAKAAFPYVRPMSFRPRGSSFIYRDFPDVYHPEFEADAAAYASVLGETAKDPAFIGYFLMNEPTWGFSTELPAAGMLYNTESCRTRDELVGFMKQRYSDDAALAKAWKMPATFERLGRGRWQGVFTREALADLQAFSVKMVDRYFLTISGACRKADPNHLNLGMRWAGTPPEWAVEGMKSFDVFSVNCYREKLPRKDSETIHAMVKKPVMVGEWHFGALDVGLPASGIGHLRNQADRAKAYRVYLEDAAANPHCVGVHWFTLYDQSAMGRYDGENYNIGFLDVCNRPYREMGEAAITSHERMYDVAAGKVAPFADAPQHVPMLFL